MARIREQHEGDRSGVAEVLGFATADLRRVYRPIVRREGTAGDGPRGAPSSLVAVEGGDVVGVVEYAVQEDAVYLQGLAVHPRYRRCGIARDLVKAVEAIASRHGKRGVTLRTIKETGNPAVFARLGFTVVNETTAEHFESPEGQPVMQVEMYRRVR